jgi:hypothetical protein
MNIPRILDLRSQLDQKSCFLIGPRQTGKSWMIRHSLSDFGVVRHLQGRREIVPGTPDYGVMLETLLFHELRAWADCRGGVGLSY